MKTYEMSIVPPEPPGTSSGNIGARLRHAAEIVMTARHKVVIAGIVIAVVALMMYLKW
jgi:hypothetical protein